MNQKNELLLLKANDPKTTTTQGHYNGPFWFLVGRQIEPEESEEQAVVREIYEETGIDEGKLSVGRVVWQGEVELVTNATPSRLRQRFMVVKTTASKLTLDHLTKEEKQVIKDIRWFSLEEIES